MQIERDYTRKNVLINGKKLSYLYSPGETHNLLFAFPQGLRPASYFAKSYKVIPKFWTVIIVDPPGIGESDSLETNTSITNIANVSLSLIKEAGFVPQETIVLGKSFSSTYIRGMLEIQPDFFAAIILAGPRLWSLKVANIFNKVCPSLKSSALLRQLSRICFWVMAKLTPIKMTYYNWGSIGAWYALHDMAAIRFSPYLAINTTCTIILNGKDSIVPPENVAEIKQSFTNAEYRILPTNSHWGEITPEEFEYIYQALVKYQQGIGRS